MASKFRIGDRVEFVDDPKDPHPNSKELMGRVGGVVRLMAADNNHDERVKIVWDTPVLGHSPGYEYACREARLKLVNVILNPASVAEKTRGGYPVISVRQTGDDERPFCALVHMPDGSSRELSYSNTGHFYRRMDTNVDLVAQ